MLLKYFSTIKHVNINMMLNALTTGSQNAYVMALRSQESLTLHGRTVPYGQLPSSILHDTEHYSSSFGTLETRNEIRKSSTIRMVIQSEIDLISDVCLISLSTSITHANITRVQTQCGGTVLDEWNSVTQLKASHSMYKKRIEFLTGGLVIPLTMAPFNSGPFPLSALQRQHHELTIIVTFESSCARLISEDKFQLWSTKVKLPAPLTDHHFTWATYQTQYQLMKNSNLYLNHPVHLIYIYDYPDGTKNISLILNDELYDKWSVSQLQYNMHCKDIYSPCLFIFFGDDELTDMPSNKSTINFSKIDKVKLLFDDVEIEKDSGIVVVAMGQQIITIQRGMCGTVFSK